MAWYRLYSTRSLAGMFTTMTEFCPKVSLFDFSTSSGCSTKAPFQRMKSRSPLSSSFSLKLSVGILHRADRGGQLHNFNHLFVAEQAAEINLPFQPDLIIMDGRRSLISGGPSHGEQVKPGVILASGDQVANDVMGIRIIQEWYPNMAANKIGMYAWYQKQIAQAAKVGVGYARKQDDIKLILG